MLQKIVLYACAALCIAVVSAQVLNAVTLNGYRFATMDQADPADANVLTQVNPIPLPNGWSIAENIAEARAAASQNSWGTECLVLADGTLVATNVGGNCDNALVADSASGARPRTKKVLMQLGTPSMLRVQPTNGPLAGGNQVTVFGTNLIQITSATLAGISASLVSQNASQVVVTAGAATAEITGPVTLTSSSLGAIPNATVISYEYLKNPIVQNGTIASVAPTTGPATGGNPITISGSNLGSGSDITQVTIGGAPATILSQTADSVVAQPVGRGISGTVRVLSASRGLTSVDNAYAFKPLGAVNSVSPSSGVVGGNNVVTVLGSGLGSGADITSVKFAMQPATIVSQGANFVVVRVPPAAAPATAHVPVFVESTSIGRTMLAWAYEYASSPYVDTLCPCSATVQAATDADCGCALTS